MSGKGSLTVASVLTAFCLCSGLRSEVPVTEGATIQLRVLYVGRSGTPRGKDREKDFVGFLEEHFATVGKGNLNKVQQKDAESFDVMILDYGRLVVESDRIMTPRIPFDRDYSRPVITVGDMGASACGKLGLKTSHG